MEEGDGTRQLLAARSGCPFRASVVAHTAARLTGRAVVSIADLALLHLGCPAVVTGCGYLINRWRHRVWRGARSAGPERPARAVPTTDLPALDPERR